MQFLIDLILKPGSSLKLIPVINVSILLLLGVLISLTYSKIATIHLVVMATLALGLLASVNYFYYEFQKVVESEKRLTETNKID